MKRWREFDSKDIHSQEFCATKARATESPGGSGDDGQMTLDQSLTPVPTVVTGLRSTGKAHTFYDILVELTD